MSAIQETEDSIEPIQVLFTMHNNMNALDFTGPLEVLTYAQYDIKDEDSKAFDTTFVGPEEHTMTAQGASFRVHINYAEAHKRLGEFDVLVVPGGNALNILKEGAEPLGLIRAFAELQEEDPSRERTILAIDTAALFLANQGLLLGLSATIHPDYVLKLEIECQNASQKAADSRTEVLDDRYVVNNARFDIAPDDPYVSTKGRKASTARKGSMLRKESNVQQASIVRRSTLRLGGLRVITTGGTTNGLDASLYLVSALVGHESAQEVGRLMKYSWLRGVVISSIDV